MSIAPSSGPRFRAVLTLLSFGFFFIGCDFLEDDADEASLSEVEYRVVALEQGGATRVHGIYFVDADGQEVMMTKVPLPWSYKGDFQTESRIGLAVAQRALGEGYESITLQIYRDGALSTEMTLQAPKGSETSITGYDSDPEADLWSGP